MIQELDKRKNNEADLEAAMGGWERDIWREEKLTKKVHFDSFISPTQWNRKRRTRDFREVTCWRCLLKITRHKLKNPAKYPETLTFKVKS